MEKRGIIISPTQKDPGHTAAEYIDPTYLRRCVLFWDLIDCPDDVHVNVPLNKNLKDITLLQKEGIFIRTKGHFFIKSEHYNVLLSVHNDNPIGFWAVSQLYAFKKHNKSDIKFSIGQLGKDMIFSEEDIGKKFFFAESPPFGPNQQTNVFALQADKLISPEAELEHGAILEVMLKKSMRIPDPETPMEEVLSLKNKRRDELLRFRHAIDKLYLDIINSEDRTTAIRYAIEEIEFAIKDLNTVMNESGWKRLSDATNITFNLLPEPNKIIENLIAGGLLGAILGSPEINAIIGAITPFIDIKVDSKALKPKNIPANLNDFAYLYNIEKELTK